MTAPVKPAEELKQLTATELQEFTRRYIETADRSFVNDRLNVKIPDHLHGEWIGLDAFSQFHARSKGFVDGAEFLTEDNIMFNTPEGGTFGDVKFMVMLKQKYLAMQEVDLLIARKRSGIGLDKDDEYKSRARELGLTVAAEESTSRVLVGNEINNAIKR